MRYALKFGYIGKGFSGYARQPGLRTVEGEIITALNESKIIDNLDGSRFQSSSRTDRGVSARGNVIALDTDFRKDAILGALNAHVRDIWFYGLAEVGDEFNPRHADMRWYRYFHIDDEIDMEKMEEAAKIFQGEHDFSNFARTEDRNPVRHIHEIEINREGDLLILDFLAESFLWHMVRRIVKAMVEYAKGDITLDEINSALDAREKMDLGLAPPEFLILMDVEYDFEIPVDKVQIKRLREIIQGYLLEMKVQKTLLEQMLKI